MESYELLARQANRYGYLPDKGSRIMAKAVKLKKGEEFKFTKGAAAVSKYPWDEWFSPDPKDFPGGLVFLERSTGTEDDKGTITEVTKKGDYEVATDAMPNKIKTAARRRYKVCDINRRDHEGKPLGDALIIRARDMTAEERAEEDELRAEEREENKKRILAAKAKKAGANGQTTPPATDAPATQPVDQATA